MSAPQRTPVKLSVGAGAVHLDVEIRGRLDRPGWLALCPNVGPADLWQPGPVDVTIIEPAELAGRRSVADQSVTDDGYLQLLGDEGFS